MASPLQETKRIKALLKKGELLPRLLLLMGEESYYIDSIEQAIVAHYIPKEDQDTERIILYGGESSMAEVASEAESSSLFAERRLIVLREAQLISDLERLEKLVAKIPPNSSLVVVYRGAMPKSKTKLLKALQELPEEVCQVVESPPIKNNRDIMAVMTQAATRYNTQLEENAKTKLIDLVGYSGSMMDKEIEKLAIAAGNAPITRELVEKLIAHTRSYTVFDLSSEIEKRNKLAILQIGSLMAQDEKNYPIPMIVGVLYEFFANLLSVHYIPFAQRNPSVIATMLNLKSSYQSDKYIRAASLYTAKETFDIIHALRMTDARYKGADEGDYRSEQLMMNLLFTICQ